MAATFQAAGIAADALDGTTPLDERRGILHRLHTGETQVVCNCTVLTEGFDEPTLDCIIIARPTQSRPFYVQMLGRGTRTHPGKADCLVLDVVGVSTRHRLQTTAALFNLSPADAVTEPVAAALATQKRRQDALDAAERGRLVHQMVDLFARRPLRWVRTHTGAWVLGLGQYGTLRLVPDGAETWRVVRLHRDGLARTLGTGLPLVYAQGQAEDLARRLGSEYLLDPQASWRQQPASEKQRKVLRKFRIPFRTSITKGEAGTFAGNVRCLLPLVQDPPAVPDAAGRARPHVRGRDSTPVRRGGRQ